MGSDVLSRIDNITNSTNNSSDFLDLLNNTSTSTIIPTVDRIATVPPSDRSSDQNSDTNTDLGTGSVPVGPIPTLPPGQDCWDNLTIVHDVLTAKNPFEQKDFVICPNKTYDICVVDVETDRCENTNENYPLWIRVNTKYICGIDGDVVDNGCIMNGGDYHISAFTGQWGSIDEIPNNVHFYGFTFTDAQKVNILMASAGYITFHNCIFEDNNNFSVLSMFYIGTITRRQLWDYYEMNNYHTNQTSSSIDYHYDSDDIMKLQQYYLYKAFQTEREYDNLLTSSSSSGQHDAKQQHQDERNEQVITLTIEFIDCIFENNTIYDISNDPSGTTGATPGMMTIFSADNILIIRNSTFLSNDYAIKSWDHSYAIDQALGSTVTLENVCFLDNSFMTDGVIISNDIELLTFTNVYTDNNSGVDIKCLFIFNNDTDTCVNADATSCTQNYMRTSPPMAAPMPVAPSASSPVPPPVKAPTPPLSPTTGSSSATGTATTTSLLRLILWSVTTCLVMTQLFR